MTKSVKIFNVTDKNPISTNYEDLFSGSGWLIGDIDNLL